MLMLICLYLLRVLRQWWGRRWQQLPALFLLWVLAGPGVAASFSESPGYVGSQACAGCHGQAFAAWQSSQHAHAMQTARADSVLADFNDTRFTYAGVTSRFYQRAGRFYVYTDGADGRMAEFEISHTFGVEPLQQYLVSFADGRLQALSIAWDTRPAAQGGQRWFHLYPEAAVDHQDALHWTQPSQNWNYMCADCHSTALRKGYDSAQDRFDTHWAEISVGCEACHGPGARHVAWAAKPDADPLRGLNLTLNSHSGSGWRQEMAKLAAKQGAIPVNPEQAICAQCHARRSQIAEGYQPGKALLDHYVPALLEPGLYHRDGQQREEVFVSASFEHSRMHAAGVTCSDCHAPHSQKLRVQGNALCGQCHVAARYDSPQHHFHPQDSAGAQCVSCHMPETTYMQIDPRRDHSLRIPQPEQSARVGAPNACNSCHREQTAQWAAQAIAKHHPHSAQAFQQFTQTWAAAQQGRAGAQAALALLLKDPQQPALVRASSVARMFNLAEPLALASVQAALQDADGQVRLAAVRAMQGANAEQQAKGLSPLLNDGLRAVRSEVARVLVDIPLKAADRPALAQALQEYEQQLQLNADRAEARTERARLRLRQQRTWEALEELNSALRLNPKHEQAYLELAELQRVLGSEAQAAQALRAGLMQLPSSALLYYALGLSEVRQQRPREALTALQQAHQLAPEHARMALTLALALQPQNPVQALAVVQQTLARHPQHPELLWLGSVYSLEQGHLQQAERWARQLLQLSPQSQRVAALLEVVAQKRSAPAAPLSR